MSVKIARISSEILRELSSILILEAKNKDFKNITLTSCDVTNDLSFANVYYTYMGERELNEIEEELKIAEPYLRTVLASKIELRHTPEIRFRYDNSIEYGMNIERIINKIHENDGKLEE